ncbi:epoxide hydrolase family protein [Rhizosaccharibacter radicis]|uniref:Epoxide hydrolase n=1 Tax=Rhizosaccharibacter radicis TaxID=2782605 RepID=A0ABT1VV38_9PROT|nr:epoxide hydrolase [Acetobacteraceae bacterium KSS12]
MSIQPFTIRVADAVLEDLRRRLDAVRWPVSLDAEGWEDGTSLAFMRHLVAYWRESFDWRHQEARLNRLPHHLAVLDGAATHFLHQPGTGPHPMPLVLTHGWPGSFMEMERLLPLLADPGAHGGDPRDAFHVVVPSLPGYGFSPAPLAPGEGSRSIAGRWRALMTSLGYRRFAAQGGDIGAGVAMWLARLFPNELLGIHLNYVPGSFRPPLGAPEPPLTPAEEDFQRRAAAFAAEGGAYAALQATRPQTLGFALTDSPVGLAAWMVEKFRAWSDCDGDLERCIPLDTLLTNICLYWFNDGPAASLRLYKENRLAPLVFPTGERVRVPCGVAVFPRELPMPPRSWVERVFPVSRWETMPAGGHFAALEQPEQLASEIRAFFRPLRDR